MNDRTASEPMPLHAAPADADVAAQVAADARARWMGILALLASAALWSLSGVLIKLLNAGGEGLSGISIACYRSLIGGLVFLPLAWRRRETLGKVKRGWPVISVATFTLMTVCFVLANTAGTASNAIILQYTSPIWVLALSPLLLGERSTRSEALVLSVAMIGVGIICFGGDRTATPALILALLSGLGYGALTVVLRVQRLVDPTVVVALNFIGSGLLLAPAVLVFDTFAVTGWQFAVLVLMSVVQFSLPYVLFSWGLQRIEAHRASLIVLLETILNPLWAFLVVHESPHRATLLGGPLILASVAGWIVLNWRRSRRGINRGET